MAIREIPAIRRFKHEDLAWVVCPVCRSRLEMTLIEVADAQIVRCTGCDRTFPVVEGIPVLLADQAKANT